MLVLVIQLLSNLGLIENTKYVLMTHDQRLC